MRKLGWVLTAIIVTFIHVPISNAETVRFPDVQQYEEEIRYLTDKNIIRGYLDGTFGPTKPLTRLQAVQMLLKAKGITDFTAPNPQLTDMTLEKYGYGEVAKAVELGIISGKTALNGTKYFDPGSYLTRGQMAKVIVEADKLPLTQTTYFLDVPSTSGFHDYISTLAGERITGGYEDGTYKPTNTVSRQHFAVFVARMLDDKFKPASVNETPSFIPDKSKAYSWEYYDDGEVIRSISRYSKMAYDGVSGWDLWKETVGDSAGYYIVMENNSGSYEITCVDIGVVSCETPNGGPYVALKYPLETGGEWGSLLNKYDSSVYTITSTNETISTKAGIFRNVVEVKDSNGWVYYYVPNIGLVKTVDNGITFAELVKLEINR